MSAEASFEPIFPVTPAMRINIEVEELQTVSFIEIQLSGATFCIGLIQ